MLKRNPKPQTALLPAAVALLALGGCGGGGTDSSPNTESVWLLNDTGRSTCSSAVTGSAVAPCPVAEAPGQDAQFGRDALARQGKLTKIGGGDAGFDFSKLGRDGMPLLIQNRDWDENGSEAEGSDWQCVRDNTTGLTWEVKHSDTSHPRYGGSTYSWYVEDPQRNGGMAGVSDAGSCNEGRCDTDGYVEFINSIALCGYSDWRLPNMSEFYSIGHQGREDPAIDDHYFPNLGGLRYWSSDPVANAPPNAWYMYFSDASISFTNKSNTSYVRLVRSEEEVNQ